MPRFTKLEREALDAACCEILAGDAREYFNGGRLVPDPPQTADEKKAVRLAEALATAQGKL